jgi:2-polyprenyl-3-methyl-5-hydroxy-6-metoxy-1,4-benzoquinol methylase
MQKTGYKKSVHFNPMKQISLYEFGGDEDAVRHIQGRFVKYFRNAGPVLDIGCGRGIFLELLTKAGIEAFGIDHSSESVAACQKKGLMVCGTDARQYLADNQGRFGGIFCSHVIEHMNYEDAMNFLELCHHALRANGIIVLVTPNPEDIAIMGEIFWLDPTHVRPYPKLLLEKMLDVNDFEVKATRRFLGKWSMVGRRNIPIYFLRRILLGKYYGRPNLLVMAEKKP